MIPKLKKSSIFLLLLFAAACNLPAAKTGENPNVPTDGIQGAWVWLDTHGDGIAGPYVQDPGSAGFTLNYNFIDKTRVAVFKSNEAPQEFAYTATKSDKREEQKLVLTGANGNIEYLWSIEVHDGSSFLILENPIACCDNDFKIKLKRTVTMQD